MKKSKALFGIAILAVATLFLGTGLVAGSPPAQDRPAAPELVLSGTVASRISYQGRLSSAGGEPLGGQFDMVFQLWNDATAGQQVSMDIVRKDVPVDDGRFSVELDVPHDAFNGQALWLRIQVDGQWLSPRQKLLPVPYALSLRPGAIIDSPNVDALHVWNRAGGYAVEAWSQNNIGLLASSGPPGSGPPPNGVHGVHGIGAGVGVYGQGGHTGVHGEGQNDGVRGESQTGKGVQGRSEKADGVFGWTNAANRSGVFGTSQVGVGTTGLSEGNDGLLGVTSSPMPGHAGVRGRNDGGGLAVAAEGDLFVTGAFRGDIGPNGGAPFPRPAWDSGWVAAPHYPQRLTLTHNLGGNVDNYVVDLQFKGQYLGIHHWNYGTNEDRDGRWAGAAYEKLTNKSIEVDRHKDDPWVEQVRVRIWIYE